MNANLAEKPSTPVPGAKPPERGSDHLIVARPAVKDKWSLHLEMILGTAFVLAMWSLAAYWFIQTRLADGWLSMRTVFEAEVRSVVREKNWRAMVVHEGTSLGVAVDWEDCVRLRPGNRICVAYVPATGYAGRCHDGRLDPELRRGAVVVLVIASFALLCLPIFVVLWRSGRVRPDVPVTLPPRPREPR